MVLENIVKTLEEILDQTQFEIDIDAGTDVIESNLKRRLQNVIDEINKEEVEVDEVIKTSVHEEYFEESVKKVIMENLKIRTKRDYHNDWDVSLGWNGEEFSADCIFYEGNDVS